MPPAASISTKFESMTSTPFADTRATTVAAPVDRLRSRASTQNVELLNMSPMLVVVGSVKGDSDHVGDQRSNRDPYGVAKRRRARCERDEHKADAADGKAEGEQFSDVSHG
jgi:hypothetical protein